MNSCVCPIIFLAILTSTSKGSQVYPESYIYDGRNVTRPAQDNCDRLTESIGNNVYRSCTHPNVLTDSVIDTCDRLGGYRPAKEKDVQFFFKFSPPVTLTHITLYYDNDDTYYSLPNVTFLEANDCEISNETQGTIIANVSAIPPGQGQQGLRNITTEIAVNVATKKLLMYVPYSNFSLRQVVFFRDYSDSDVLNTTCAVFLTSATATLTLLESHTIQMKKATNSTPLFSVIDSIPQATAFGINQGHHSKTLTVSSVTSSSRLAVSTSRTNNNQGSDGTLASLLGTAVSTSRTNNNQGSDGTLTSLLGTAVSTSGTSINQGNGTLTPNSSLLGAAVSTSRTSINQGSGTLTPNSSLLVAGVSVAVFALLLCFIGIPLISILVIRCSKGRCRQRSKKSIAKPAQPQGSQFHSSTSEKIELCENSNSEYACIGVSYKSTAMTSSANVDLCSPGESKVSRHIAMPDMSHDEIEEINPYSYSTIPTGNMLSTQHNIASKLPPHRPLKLPAIPSSLHSHNHEEDALTDTTAPKKEVKHKSKQAAHEAPIEVDEDAPSVPPQTVDCLYAAVMKRKPPTLGPAT